MTQPKTEPSPRTPVRVRSAHASWRQIVRQTRLEAAAALGTVPFLVLLAIAVLLTLVIASIVGDVRDTPVFPVTHLMLRAIERSMGLFLLIVTVLYAGELVWRERSLKVAEIYDALPVPSWILLGAKILALSTLIAVFLTTGAAATIGYQLFRGYTHLELGLYASGLALAAIPFFLMAVVAFFLQVAVNNKLLGYLAMLIFIGLRAALRAVGLEHELYRFPGQVRVPYSDMNGYGHLLAPYLWSKLYWGFAAAALVGLSLLLWVRGSESTAGARLTAARTRWRGPLPWIVGLALMGFLASGAFIYYNTNVLNAYVPKKGAAALRAEYEKRYRQYRRVPQPRISRVRTEVDIFPEQRRVEIRGSYRLVNRTANPIASLHLSLDPDVHVSRLELPAHHKTPTDEHLGYAIYELVEPMPAGAVMDLGFHLTIDQTGFVAGEPNTRIVGNGTFFANGQYLPSIGYDSSVELVGRGPRRKHDLPPRPPMADTDDAFELQRNYAALDADWIDFEATVSTSAGQVAVAPGTLIRSWAAGDRRYFHYRAETPILNFYAFLSADYAIRRDRWREVAIEVYHHPRHTYDIDRMIDASKKSLDYFTASFGPFPHPVMRIVEFPCYASFAQSFATTIPFSEAAGFIADVDSSKDIDYVFNTTAHEIAHQWWAHQVIGANVQGATMLSEALAEYSSLMVMERECGPTRMRRFLTYEMDGYLKGRSREGLDEVPLARVDRQMFIPYNKGSLVMYALKDYLGEKAVNRALRHFLQAFAFQGPPYPTSRDLLAFIEEETPPELTYLIEDLFEAITLFDNRAQRATARAADDGTYLVTLETSSRKLRADGQGVESEVPMDDWIDIGVFGETQDGDDWPGEVLFLEKRKVGEGRTTFELMVNAKPARAGIDPYNKLIDRDSDDNVAEVVTAGR